jgi:lipopolysaccharide transport system ATP-binding protein
MIDSVAISVRDVSKCYRVFESRRARLFNACWPEYRTGMKEIWALKDISFDITRGESVAIIGRNGSGKSTLLEILTGSLTRTSGSVRVSGRVSALLELGSGFSPEYSGRDNVVLNGLLLGLTREEILRRFDEIAAFADIGDALDRPVKTYSSGMVMRLAFAVQVLTDPDILIIDEALSVGDFFFQQKCYGHIRALCERGVTLLFVSHDMGIVRDLCQRAIYLKEGHVQFVGKAQTAIHQYFAERRGVAGSESYSTDDGETAGAHVVEDIRRDSIWAATPTGSRGEARHLIAVAFYDDDGKPATSFRMGSFMCIKVAYLPAPGKPTHVTVEIRNKYDSIATVLGSARMGLAPPATQPGQPLIFEMRVDLLLEAGNYSVTVNLGHPTLPNQGEFLDSSGRLGPLIVDWNYEKDQAPFLGMFGLPAKGSFVKGRADDDGASSLSRPR